MLPRLQVVIIFEIGNYFSMYRKIQVILAVFTKMTFTWESYQMERKHSGLRTVNRGYQLLCKQLIHVGGVINQIVDVY